MRARSRVAADAAKRAADVRHLRRWVGPGAGGERHNSGRRGGAWRNYSACGRVRDGDRMWRRSPVCMDTGARRGRGSAASGVVVRRDRGADAPRRTASLAAGEPRQLGQQVGLTVSSEASVQRQSPDHVPDHRKGDSSHRSPRADRPGQLLASPEHSDRRSLRRSSERPRAAARPRRISSAAIFLTHHLERSFAEATARARPPRSPARRRRVPSPVSGAGPGANARFA